MKKPIKVFEPVTGDQIKILHSKARKRVLTELEMYTQINALIGIPSITALSKQEAIFLIDSFQGKQKRRYPTVPRLENEIEGDTSALPSFYHIRDIREMVQELGWDKQQMKNWLVKYRKVKNIRLMDRKQARISYFILKGMVKNAGTDQNKHKREEP